MINILMSGCNGKMGQVITKLAANFDNLIIAAGVSRHTDKLSNSYPVYKDYKEVQEKIDVVVDFSNPENLPQILGFCTAHESALVIATTGLSHEDYELIRQASENIPIFISANMSLGINVMIEIAKTAISRLGLGFDIEILEKHHNEKKDAPSGTALMIANEINQYLDNSLEYTYDRSQKKEKRKQREIGISAIRGGTIPGEHSIYFAGKDEIIEIKHTALSRDIFAIGAIKAALYISTRQNGIYDMKSMLKEMI